MCRFATTFNDTGFVKYLVCDEQGIALLPRFGLSVKSAASSGTATGVVKTETFMPSGQAHVY